MPITSSIVRSWVDWVRSADPINPITPQGEPGALWKRGWRVNFWYVLSSEWSRFNDPVLRNLREVEACWDPESEI